MSTAAQLRVEYERLLNEETRLRVEYDAFGTQISSLIDQQRPINAEIRNQRSIITDPNATPAQKDAATIRGTELENQYNNIDRQINRIRDQQRTFLQSGPLGQVQKQLYTAGTGLRDRIKQAEQQEKKAADEAEATKNEETALAIEKENEEREARIRAQVAGQSNPEDSQPVGEPASEVDQQDIENTVKQNTENESIKTYIDENGVERTENGSMVIRSDGVGDQTNDDIAGTGDGGNQTQSSTGGSDTADTNLEESSGGDGTNGGDSNGSTEGSGFGGDPSNNSVTGAKNTKKIQIPIENPLDLYDSYTYAITFRIMSFEDYNSMVDNPTTFSIFNSPVLISSAARKNDELIRQEAFLNTEFFIEDLKFNTIINTTIRNRNSNILEGSFKIIEPLGFTFIDRLTYAAASVGSPQMSQQCYMLQLDFFGFENGEIKPNPIENMSKYFPIAILDISSKITEMGSEYNINFSAFNHQAFSEDCVAIPSTFKISGKTLQDLVGYTFSEEDVQEQDSGTQIQSLYNGTGLIDGINKFYENASIKDKNGSRFNSYKIVLDPVIANAKYTPSLSNPISRPTVTGKDEKSKKDSTRSAYDYSAKKLDKDSVELTIGAGTKLDQIIEHLIRNSDYIRNQLKNPDVDPNDRSETINGQPFKWFKIYPKMKHIGFDATRNSNVYDITYYVVPFEIASKHPAVRDKPRIQGYVKEYQYIFTGKNKNIIDFNIDFVNYYVTRLKAFPNKRSIMQNRGVNNYKSQTDASFIGGTSNPNKPLPTFNENINPTSSDNIFKQRLETKSETGGGRTSRTGDELSYASIAAEVADDITVGAAGDLLNVKLRIIGDPHYVKQDDLFYDILSNSDLKQLTTNNSLYMDGNELYVLLVFKTPSDYDEKTGLTDLNTTPFKYSKFSGVYRVLVIENIFDSGKFEQVLELARVLPSDNERIIISEIEQTKQEALEKLVQKKDPPLATPKNVAESPFLGPVIQKSLSKGGQIVQLPTLADIEAEINDATRAIGDAISDATGAIGDAISDATGAIGDAISDATGAIGDVVNEVGTALNNVTNQIQNVNGIISSPTLDGISSQVDNIRGVAAEVETYTGAGLVDSYGRPVLDGSGNPIRTGE